MSTCKVAHFYAPDHERPSGYVCTKPAGHTPPDRHEDTTGGRSRRWTEPVSVLPNRADRRADRRVARKRGAIR